jgi:hypothetical protein
LPQCHQETLASFGVDVELSGQLVGRSGTTAERLEKAEINSGKQGL